MHRVLCLSSSIVLAHLLAVHGFVQQSFARLRTNGMEKGGYRYYADRTAFSTRPPLPVACSSSPTIQENAAKNEDTLCSPFRHCSTVYIEMTDM